MRLTYIALALVLTACGGRGDSGGGPSVSRGSPSGGGSKIVMTDNTFTPDAVTVSPGTAVALQLENKGIAEHTFTLKEGGVNVDVTVGAGGTGVAGFTAPKVGSYKWVCKIHESVGMVGTLTVT